MTIAPRAAWLGGCMISVAVSVLAIGSFAAVRADAAALQGVPSDAALPAWAMQWFAEMRAGRTDLSHYAPAFAPEVTAEAIQKISHDLNKYGASPLRAEIVQSEKRSDQSFYVLKFVFPRGDATSLLFGFDAEGRITGIAVGGLAGD